MDKLYYTIDAVEERLFIDKLANLFSLSTGICSGICALYGVPVFRKASMKVFCVFLILKYITGTTQVNRSPEAGIMADPNKEYTPPDTLGGVYDNIQFDTPLEPNDPRYVDTIPGRGDFNFREIYQSYKVNPETSSFDQAPPQKVYTLFCGHRGCGKSTELKRIASSLDKDNLFFVVFLDTSIELDNNNVHYVDVFMALAKKLFERLQTLDLGIDPVFLKNLEAWFSERILVNGQCRDFSSSIESGIKAEAGIPYLFTLFSRLTSSFKINATYKNELRTTIKNTFSQFSDCFNQLLMAVSDRITTINRQSLLFMVDGLDKLSAEDAKKFFVNDVTQLRQINANFIYTGPIDLFCSGTQTQQLFNFSILPMIKIHERNGAKNEKGFLALRNMIYKRAHKNLFSSETDVDKIIEFSGGNPRQVLQLIQYAYQNASIDIFDAECIDKAIHKLANTFRYFLTAEDYKLLHEIDHSPLEEHVQSLRTRKLLYELALLQYNDWWWKSHPVVRTLPGYKKYGQKK